MQVRDYDPGQGQAFQGDIAIIPIPDDLEVATCDEIAPADGRLIVQQGELTGHHHAIFLSENGRLFRDDALARQSASSTPAAKLHPAMQAGTARLYRDDRVVQNMIQRGLLMRPDLAIGCLVVEDGSVVISHEEHDGIRIPTGKYLVGRQAERSGRMLRPVCD